MADRGNVTKNTETVIKGLECCTGEGFGCHECPPECPYADADETEEICENQLKRDAAALLRELLKEEDDGK